MFKLMEYPLETCHVTNTLNFAQNRGKKSSGTAKAIGYDDMTGRKVFHFINIMFLVSEFRTQTH